MGLSVLASAKLQRTQSVSGLRRLNQSNSFWLDVQTALELGRTSGRSGGLRRRRWGGCSSGVAADRGVALFVERVVRQVVLLHVRVDFPAGPVQQRGNRVAVVTLRPLDESGRPCGCRPGSGGCRAARRGASSLIARSIGSFLLVAQQASTSFRQLGFSSPAL